MAVYPSRIVSLVPSQTELLADLGLNNEVVGLTRFCIRPQGWRKAKAIIGGTKNVRIDRVAALRPDLILANKEENVREQVEALADIAPVHVTDVATVPGALTMIREVGLLVDRNEAANALAVAIEQRFRRLPSTPTLRAVYLIWRSPYMTVGGDTFIHDVMQRAGLVNVFGDRDRYPEVNVSDMIAAEPDVVLLSSEPFPFGPTHLAELEATTGISATLVDGEMFSWYGSRLLQTPAYLANLHARLASSLS